MIKDVIICKCSTSNTKGKSYLVIDINGKIIRGFDMFESKKCIEIRMLAEKFRSAIDTVVDNRELTIHPFDKFPNDCCDMTSELLSHYLTEHNIQNQLIIGTHRNDFQWNHVWVQTMDDIVVDITGDQFDGKPNMPDDVCRVYVGKEGDVQKMFCENRQFETPTNFKESIYDSFGIPNRRKSDLLKAYNIIERYLCAEELKGS